MQHHLLSFSMLGSHFIQPHLAPGGATTDPLHVGRQAHSMANPYDIAAEDYSQLRPPYPHDALTYIASHLPSAPSLSLSKTRPLINNDAIGYSALRPSPHKIIDLNNTSNPSSTIDLVDIGSGNGFFLWQLARFLDPTQRVTITAVEPSSAMRASFHHERFKANLPSQWSCELVDASAEELPLTSSHYNAVACAQAWHWLDAQKVSKELGRIMLPGSPVFIIFNQLNVEFAWIKRLTRIMRSGDIHRSDKPPRLSPDFTTPTLHSTSFTHCLTPQQVLALGRTRSSYLRSSPSGREHMQNNLRWYIYDHMGFCDEQLIELPYLCFVWLAHYQPINSMRSS
ncbi:MAG: class I SAM-dependent methyltransferase [Actinomycetaceae bacterium]|nr:class I SAM-dependent methyltransferase [Actinomycetaceae bacterium]